MTTHTPGPLRADAQTLWRRQLDCGCYVLGGGTVNDPLTVELCPTHAAAPALLAALRQTVGRLEFLHGLEHDRLACGHIDNAAWLDDARTMLRTIEP